MFKEKEIVIDCRSKEQKRAERIEWLKKHAVPVAIVGAIVANVAVGLITKQK